MEESSINYRSPSGSFAYQPQGEILAPSVRFDFEEAYKLTQNLQQNIYSEIVNYLTDERGLSSKVLAKYKVGVGRERFADDEGHMCDFDAVYFPMYAPRKDKASIETSTMNEYSQQLKTDKKTMQRLEHEVEINNDMA